MKRWLLRIGMSLPYAFLAMGCDALWGISLAYPAAVLCAAVLTILARKAEKAFVCFVCGGIGLALSAALSACVTAERWRWYFKPFSAQFMAAVISLIIIGVQWILVRRRRG